MRRSRGFTLVELMVVIVVLALLVALLTPAVMRAVKTANAAAAAADIRSLEQSLASFKNKYGAYPPSRIVVAEDGNYSSANLDSIPNNEGVLLSPRTLTYLRRFWPRVAFATDGSKPKIPDGGWYDFNGDHVLNPPYIMEGHECLAFFLGGVPEHTKTSSGVSGFSVNPLNPFTSPQEPPKPPAPQWPYSSNRSAPFYSTRIMPTTGGKVACADIHGNKSWYAYFSAYGGAGYDPDDVNAPEVDDDSGLPNILGAIHTNAAATPKGNTVRADIVLSPAPNPYTDDSPFPTNAAGDYVPAERRRRKFYTDTTYQIISAGDDRQFGIGGEYSPKQSEALPFYATASKGFTGQTLTKAVRLREKDNVTNFSAGKLD